MTTTTNKRQFTVGEWTVSISDAGEWELSFHGMVCWGNVPCSADLQKMSAELMKLALEAKKAGY